MDIPALMKIIRRKWLFISAFTLIVVFATAGISFYQLDPTYEATTTLIVQVEPSSGQIVYNDLLTGQQLVGTYKEIIQSRLIANDVRKRLELPMTTDELLGRIRVESPSESIMTSIIARDQDPERVVAIVNAFADSFSRNIGSIMKLDNLSILDRAVYDENTPPISPRPALYTASSLLVGLMCSIGAAILLEQLDHTMRTEEQVGESVGLTVLGTVPVIAANNRQPKKRKEGGMILEEQAKGSKFNIPV